MYLIAIFWGMEKIYPILPRDDKNGITEHFDNGS
jgi:hypothetical protein